MGFRVLVPHCDSAPTHSPLPMCVWLKKVIVVSHLLRSLSLVLCGLFLFQKLKMTLKGGELNGIIIIKAKSAGALTIFQAVYFLKCSEWWCIYWNRCISYQGDYFEVDSIACKVLLVRCSKFTMYVMLRPALKQTATFIHSHLVWVRGQQCWSVLLSCREHRSLGGPCDGDKSHRSWGWIVRSVLWEVSFTACELAQPRTGWRAVAVHWGPCKVSVLQPPQHDTVCRIVLCSCSSTTAHHTLCAVKSEALKYFLSSKLEVV